MNRDVVKRAVDVVGAVVALAVLLPVLLAVAALVVATMGRPVLFRQVRVGRAERAFTVVKFRTMVPGGGLDTDGDRLTAVGRFLRRTSLDELPTLWNVLLGHMSLVGPRPLLTHYLDRYTPHQARRHEVRPGITGLAQVEGRNLLAWEDKLDRDVWYVDHRSFALDARILVRTVAVVVRRTGITAEGEATMSEFMGVPRERPRPDRDGVAPV
ncbi:sugar transferase [Luedemannella flava]|uniref:Sugar transferase n=1 Tax=Luedemannella flava TaxID=349316 RepID=A0ABN2MEH0_9ACTN